MYELLIAGVPTDEDWKQAGRFHGHIGPWLAVGMRLGDAAVAELVIRSHFDVHVDAACPLHTPFSCLLDGLQVGTGATLGKRNITALESGPTEISVTVANKETGRCLRFDLRPEAGQLISGWFDELGGEGAAKKVWSEPFDSLFVVRRDLNWAKKE
jgi:formylmethanofuran dehydrogenase subunit E